MDFNQGRRPSPKLRVSVIVLALGVLMLVSLLNPYQEPPFGGHHYLQWLASIIVLLGAFALVRKERGRAAALSAWLTLAAAAFLFLTIVGGAFFAAVMKLAMPD